MPISEYFHGHGEKVKSAMTAKYGSEKGERIFYATANKTHQTPKERPTHGTKINPHRKDT